MTKPVSITRDDLIAMNPCDLEQRLALFGRRKSLNARQALGAGASVSDLLWVAGQLGLKAQLVTFALRAAERVAHLNPDPRVGAALETARRWLADPSEKNRRAADTSAAAARHVAAFRPACDAAYAAAYAASATSAIAASAASALATLAAVYAASASAHAYIDGEREIQKAIFLEIFG